MGITDSMEFDNQLRRSSQGGIVAVIALVCLSGIGIANDQWKVFIISWIGFAAMAGAAIPGSRAEATNAGQLVWGYGLASGAMIASASIFLIPQAIGFSATAGGIGIAIGVLLGYGAHTIGHRLSHVESFGTVAVQLSAHSLAGGAIIGLVYAALPDLGLLLGLSIVSHKGPAGYAAARRLSRRGHDPSVLLVPAAAVGVAALPASMLNLPVSMAGNAVISGIATGIFLHIAMDFLPQCDTGSEIGQAVGHDESAAVHAELDRLRVHAVVSTVLGSGAVVLAWTVLAR
ncbi:ZIP family metal transporter [Halocatena pleomorpha]|uniref:ZIP family metal transporter n=1 Tax=Halocatena pleomorpha TaxID=1785090 RepID=A0A3P3RA65_9EURY|nr:ZIP family metal transporter [Halocatena pleomorpha]RRJ30371.1 ZIP family metal transporter [Halocatena pleomorpha]